MLLLLPGLKPDLTPEPLITGPEGPGMMYPLYPSLRDPDCYVNFVLHFQTSLDVTSFFSNTKKVILC